MKMAPKHLLPGTRLGAILVYGRSFDFGKMLSSEKCSLGTVPGGCAGRLLFDGLLADAPVAR